MSEAIPLPIQMSDAAAAKIQSLITEEENPDCACGSTLPAAVVRALNMALPSMKKPMTAIPSSKKRGHHGRR